MITSSAVLMSSSPTRGRKMSPDIVGHPVEMAETATKDGRQKSQQRNPHGRDEHGRGGALARNCGHVLEQPCFDHEFGDLRAVER